MEKRLDILDIIDGDNGIEMEKRLDILDIIDGDKKETGCYPVSTSPVEGLFAKKLVID